MSVPAAKSLLVLCQHCHQPIRRRGDVVIMGRMFVPIHEACLPAYRAARPWFLRGMPMNRRSSFLLVNAGALVLIGIVAAFSPSTPLAHVALIPLVANLWLLLGRAVSFVAIERHIPRQG
ncbi:MAG: hypothetical protein ACO1QR_09480 [Chthoniobacteraceae bacterium]